MGMFQYKFPELGEGIHEGEIVKLLIKPGDKVNDESILMEVQNDKAVVEVPCPVEGTVKEVKVKEGQVCHVDELVAVIEVEGEIEGSEGPAAGGSDTTAAQAQAQRKRSLKQQAKKAPLLLLLPRQLQRRARGKRLPQPMPKKCWPPRVCASLREKRAWIYRNLTAPAKTAALRGKTSPGSPLVNRPPHPKRLKRLQLLRPRLRLLQLATVRKNV